MPKTDVTKPRSDDVAELSDEALDRVATAQACYSGPFCVDCYPVGPET
ncbi:MAG: hypothetical protein ISR48_03750 [Alphaproteobacteria bacterium]|nr:hypothetical protein [Alphaproteobacteria bacterium]